MKPKLPRNSTELSGLRAARWIRESSTSQFDNFGPDAQRGHQDRAIARFGMIDSSIAWHVAHSGTTVARTPEFADMLARAGRDYDVLVVGYVSRFARNLHTAVNARHDLHLRGAAVLFCDEGILSSDEGQWKQWVDEATESESYSRKLGKRISEGFAAKHLRGDQGGTTPFGFRRDPEPPRLLEIDPATIGQAVAIFEMYATGTHSFASLAAEVGMAPERIREILAAPIFNGYFRRGKRAKEESRRAAPWRSHNPPVSDELWDRVQLVRRAKTHGGGQRRADRIDLLSGLLYCTCGRYVKANGTSGSGTVRVHVGRCKKWGGRATYPSQTWLRPLAEQVRQIDLSPTTIARVTAALRQSAPRSDELAGKRLQRRRLEAAEAFAGGRMGLDAFTTRVAELDEERRSLDADAKATPAPVPASAVGAYLTDLRATWRDADDRARADLLHAIYKRVEVRGDEFVLAHLTPEAEAHGLALALPEKVALARPAGAGHARAIRYRIHIVGRTEELGAIRRLKLA